ncbi:MAG: transglycosylase domain-containing protein [Lachnospiraceae bacterium]|nr:transglycosylase domain-containing protein [Lachnospiraceae bacterium]
MNFSDKAVRRKLIVSSSPYYKVFNKFAVTLLSTLLLAVIFAISTGGALAYGAFRAILDTTPEISVEDVTPSGYASTMYDSEEHEMLTLVQAGSNRSLVYYDQLPQHLIDAFIAIEDERFETHNGIDLKGILRAAIIGMSKMHFSEGASTITQQLIKNNIFAGGTETTFGDKIVRKIHEQSLATQLEKQVSKEWILENYLNTINLGNNTLGVQSAANRYFNKDVSELTLSESAVIAAITQNPSLYNPIRHPDKNAERRKKVLDNMLDQGKIDQKEYADAIKDDVYSRIQNVNLAGGSSIYTFFEDAVIESVVQDLQTKLGYSQTQAYNLLYSGGLHIYSTQNTKIQEIMDNVINNPEYYPETKYSCSYSLRVSHTDGTSDNYTESDVRKYLQNKMRNQRAQLLFNTEDLMREFIDEFREEKVDKEAGDKIVSETLSPILEPQVSMTILDNRTGYVAAICGGRGEKTGSLALNRAIDSTRSPGSCFKVLADFAPAIDICGDTLASTYYDSPLSEEYDFKFNNWWGDYYMGYTNIRQGITCSMNMTASKCLLETVTPSLGFQYASNFGISTLVENRTLADGTVVSDVVPSICLGGLTDGVTNLELTAAYEAIANGGTYVEPIFYTRVTDQHGKLLLDNSQERHTVLKPSTATLLTKAMEHVFDDTILYAENTAGERIVVQPTCINLGLTRMTCAGKSGSTTSNNDIWFEGYTPYYTCGIWAGYDDTLAFGGGQTFHKEIWKAVMDAVHQDLQVIDFPEYAPLETAKICSKSGLLAIDGVCDAEGSNSLVYEEYFAEGTAPTEYCNCHVAMNICPESGHLATENCPTSEQRVYMLLDRSLITEGVHTYDEDFLPPEEASTPCTMHEPETEEESSEEESEEDDKKKDDKKNKEED